MKYLNIDQIVPDEQVLEIGGRKFNLANTPARKTTELLRIGSWAQSSEVKSDPSRTYEAYEKELAALVDVLGTDQEGEPATFEWVIDNVSNAQLSAIIEFVSECLSGSDKEVAEGETPANFTPNREQRRAAARKTKK